MGRALYSKAYEPVIREPSPSQYEKWSISPFDPDSEEFFEDAQYEAFLPDPPSANPSASSDMAGAEPRMFVSSARTTTMRDSDHPARTSRVRISNEVLTSSNPNPMILDSVPHDLPDMDAPTLPPSPPPISLRDFNDDMESSRPTLSPMAGDSDAEDPMRILQDFVTEYRAMRRPGDGLPTITVSEILRSMDGEWARQQLQRPQRYLPPLEYSSSNSDSASSRASSPASSTFIPSPAIPPPPQMTREEDAFSVPLPFDEDLEQDAGRDLSSNSDDSRLDAPVPFSEPSVPTDEPQTPPRAIYIRHGTPGSLGHDVGLDMSPPPSVSPRLYNWSHPGPESRPRFSPANTYARRSYTSGRI